MSKTSTDKEKELQQIHLEAVRYAELHRNDFDLSDEFDAAIYSTWYLLNPLGLKHRDSIGTTEPCEEILPRERTKSLRFTAHAHHSEPLTLSPDDILIYTTLTRRGKFLHFIIDRFICRRVKLNDKSALK